MDSALTLEKVTEIAGEAARGEAYAIWFLIGAALVFFMQVTLL